MRVYCSLILFLSTRLTLGEAVDGSMPDLGSITNSLPDFGSITDQCGSCTDFFTKLFSSEGESKKDKKSKKEDEGASWENEHYKVERRHVKNNGECVEEINILWNGDEKPLQFKPKCLEDGTFRTAYHANNQVLIIGSPNDDFLFFSKKDRQFFSKENDNWKKGSVESGGVNESPVTSEDDILDIKDCHEIYMDLFSTFNKKIKIHNIDIKEEEGKHSAEIEKLNKLKEEENTRWEGELKKETKGFGKIAKAFSKKTDANQHEKKLNDLETALRTENDRHKEEVTKLKVNIEKFNTDFDSQCKQQQTYDRI